MRNTEKNIVRALAILNNSYKFEEVKKLSNCSKGAIISRIDSNNIALSDALVKNDFERAGQINAENMRLFALVNSANFSEERAKIALTADDIEIPVSYSLNIEQLQIDQLQKELNKVRKELENALQTIEKNENK